MHSKQLIIQEFILNVNIFINIFSIKNFDYGKVSEIECNVHLIIKQLQIFNVFLQWL